MKVWMIRLLAIVFCLVTMSQMQIATAVDDDDDKPDPSKGALPTLNGEQQQAIGIITAHPVAAKTPERIDALGIVLDASTLITDLGEMESARVAQQTAAAELARLHGLYSGGAGASLKTLEAAQADQAKSRAQAESANARFALHWGPLAMLPLAERQKLIEAVSANRRLLLRADVLGRHSIGTLPDKAMLDVDGIQVPARVLGNLLQTGEAQGVGVLIEVDNAPSGLGPGARLPVVLLAAARDGLLLPRKAILYDENGAYVYKRLAKKAGDKGTSYAPVKVTLVAVYGDGWLVDGVDDDDDIVVHGAGVLWSLQGMSGHPVDDDD